MFGASAWLSSLTFLSCSVLYLVLASWQIPSSVRAPISFLFLATEGVSDRANHAGRWGINTDDSLAAALDRRVHTTTGWAFAFLRSVPLFPLGLRALPLPWISRALPPVLRASPSISPVSFIGFYSQSLSRSRVLMIAARFDGFLVVGAS